MVPLGTLLCLESGGGGSGLEAESGERHFAFFEEFVVGGLDFLHGVVGEAEAFDDAPFADGVDLDGQGGDDAFRGAVFAAGDDADRVEVAAGWG